MLPPHVLPTLTLPLLLLTHRSTANKLPDIRPMDTQLAELPTTANKPLTTTTTTTTTNSTLAPHLQPTPVHLLTFPPRECIIDPHTQRKDLTPELRALSMPEIIRKTYTTRMYRDTAPPNKLDDAKTKESGDAMWLWWDPKKDTRPPGLEEAFFGVSMQCHTDLKKSPGEGEAREALMAIVGKTACRRAEPKVKAEKRVMDADGRHPCTELAHHGNAVIELCGPTDNWVYCSNIVGWVTPLLSECEQKGRTEGTIDIWAGAKTHQTGLSIRVRSKSHIPEPVPVAPVAPVAPPPPPPPKKDEPKKKEEKKDGKQFQIHIVPMGSDKPVANITANIIAAETVAAKAGAPSPAPRPEEKKVPPPTTTTEKPGATQAPPQAVAAPAPAPSAASEAAALSGPSLSRMQYTLLALAVPLVVAVYAA
ncbi:hypothetical protein EX30DRAFT_395160 [Ascodesmis nigricans]|uniref:Uncharacterized protein n=1 Tax=Ascodesmis nigricans TaxID=341454 RepID=A0A4S2N065_9PEZI|nr:hypothetical protein EX30DRAFT_395160 [Ascodesmis nigricans]